MALTQQALQNLLGKGFDAVYRRNRVQWTRRARTAYEFISKNLPENAEVRVDDVAEVLVPVLAVDLEIRRFLQVKKLRQKYWVRDCCDYILDQVWGELTHERRGGGSR